MIKVLVKKDVIEITGHSDYDTIDLLLIDDMYLPRTKYSVKCSKEEFQNKVFVLGSTETNETMANKSGIITTLQSSLDEIVEKQLVVRIWYEGTDREADQALGGGHVNVKLKFNGLQEKENLPNDIVELMKSIKFTTSGISVTGVEEVTEEIQYSINNCYSWHYCTEDNVINLINSINGRKKPLNVYFRYPESTSNYDYIVSHHFDYNGGAA